MDDYEIDTDLDCPKCGHSSVHFRWCGVIHCEDGWIDLGDEDDYTEGESWEPCQECHGTGIERWCPSCGVDIWYEGEEVLYA